MPRQDRPNQGEEQPSRIKTAIQVMGMFFLSRIIFNQFAGSSSPNTNSPGQPGAVLPFEDRPARHEIVNYSPIPELVSPIWAADRSLDIKIYVSPYIGLPALTSIPSSALVADEKNFPIGNLSETREIEATITLAESVQNNGTLWAHFYVALSGHQQDPAAKDYNTETAVHFVRPLNSYLPKRKLKKKKNLLSAADQPEEVEEDNSPDVSIASFYHPNVTLAVIPDSGVQKYKFLHPAVRQHMQLETSGARDPSGQNGWYYPILFLNKFWQLKSHMTELNSTVETVPLRITLSHMRNWQFSLLTSLDEGMKQTALQSANGGSVPAGGDGSEFEMLKEVLLDTNPYMLATTGIVSVFHMIFETLAFKNDISHWRKKKDNVGTSVRTILANVFMQAVIFLYLIDNREGTSWMILASQGFSILLEAWKITKTVDVRLRPPPTNSLFSFLPFVIVFEDKHKLSETEKKTKEYDEIAFKYLYIIAVPLLAAYAIYSVMYQEHKSWYSFIIETLVGSVYAYGFLMMVPSLYINYRLQSVAHMPGRALTYKFLNTFIDDLFAFTIKMPWLYRIATLRDDIIFFVWVYQSYKYKVDYTRVNEFGQGGESDEEADEVVDGSASDKGPPAAIKASSSTSSSKPLAGAGETSAARKRK